MATFKELLQQSFKSKDTEEWLDVHFTRPIGLVFALLWNKLGIHPNVITIFSIFLGAAAGCMFYFTDLPHNVAGVLLLMLADFCDSTDGQMARLSGKRTLLGRILDGFSGDVWFVFIYVAIGCRLYDQPMPGTTYTWGIWGFVLGAIAGFLCHSPQSSLADYYRQIHLFFLEGKDHSELDNSLAQRKIMNSLPKSKWFERLYYYFYGNYCKSQEKRTPQFQHFFALWNKAVAARPSDPRLATVRQQFLEGSRPLMKYTNLLTFNSRAITIYVTCLLNCPWLYLLFEIIVLTLLYIRMHKRHEDLCDRLAKSEVLSENAGAPSYAAGTSERTGVDRVASSSKGIKGFLFDYGGTLDTGGDHWGKVIWHAYERQQVPVGEADFREAYVYAERTLGKNPIIKSDFTFHDTLSTKLRLEMEHLRDAGVWDTTEFELEAKHAAVLDDLYSHVKATTGHSREVLEQLHSRFPMVLVSNFYGNIAVVLKEFGLDNLFQSIVESAVVGVRKPNPHIFTLGVERLGLKADEVVVVGDSFTKDIEPALKAGCHAIWFKGEGWTNETFDETLPDKVITDLQQLLAWVQ